MATNESSAGEVDKEIRNYSLFSKNIFLIFFRFLSWNGEKLLFPVIVFCCHVIHTFLPLIIKKHIHWFFPFKSHQRTEDDNSLCPSSKQSANTTSNQNPANLIRLRIMGDLKWTILVTQRAMKRQHEMEFFYHYKQVWQVVGTHPLI